jgi:lipopolysaccharide transport system ATP-binding protein
MSDTMIRVENLSKKYLLNHQQGEHSNYKSMRESWTNGISSLGKKILNPRSNKTFKPSQEEFWALKDVSFEIKQGDRVGIIGRNGAGKSTLLKILSRITEPTSGRIGINGRIASLLEVGTGFHPELTGRENIFLNGAILGMSRSEIQRKFDEIVDFAEVEKFLDTPVKRYSSGMYVRLAFAVAAHLEPEILIVDEVLAVGDSQFQKKCLGKMEDVAKNEGRTILFVSHNLPSVQALCQRAILLQAGSVKMDDTPEEVIPNYLFIDSSVENGEVDLSNHRGRSRSQDPALKKVWIVNHQGIKTNCVLMDAPLTIYIQFHSSRPIIRPIFIFAIEDEYGERIFTLTNEMAPTSNNQPELIQEGIASLEIANLPLLSGAYFITIKLQESQKTFDLVAQAMMIEVLPNDVFGSGKIPQGAQGKIFVKGEISVHNKAESLVMSE